MTLAAYAEVLAGTNRADEAKRCRDKAQAIVAALTSTTR
jgi:hypothetical protein